MGKKNKRLWMMVVWLLIWQAAAMLIHNHIIFAGPLDTFRTLLSFLITPQFYLTILHTLIRIAAGFFLAFLTGTILAAAAGKISLLREFAEPFFSTIQSIPVASFVILALIWIGSKNLSVLITFLIVLPMMYRNTVAALEQIDLKIKEMMTVYDATIGIRLWYLYRPAWMPYLFAGAKSAIGMAWKSGIAAEVIAVPGNSIGEKLYLSKIYLATEELFAWTFVIILVSKAFEWIFLRFAGLLARDMQGKRRLKNSTGKKHIISVSSVGNNAPVTLSHISKSYGNHTVLKDVSFSFMPGKRYAIMGPSGCGKTTLLRILMGLELPDKGDLCTPSSISAVFQEDRLIEFVTGFENISLSSHRGYLADPGEALEKLSLSEAFYLMASDLSGGMKRRVSLARALCVKSSMVILDEPFNGLDEKARQKAIEVILQCLKGRTLVIVTHRIEDAEALNAEIVSWH